MIVHYTVTTHYDLSQRVESRQFTLYTDNGGLVGERVRSLGPTLEMKRVTVVCADGTRIPGDAWKLKQENGR